LEIQSYRVLNNTIGWLSLALMLGISGCSTARSISDGYPKEDLVPHADGPQSLKSTEVMGPPEEFGPPSPEEMPVYGPEPVQMRPVVLVLSPGMARGFAHVGVLEALSDSKIPIGAILGTEMGALMGALYTTSPTVNQFDWKVLKIKEDFFFSRSLLGPAKARSQVGPELKVLIQQVFGDKKISDALIPIYLAGPSKLGKFELIFKGQLSQAVAQALGGVWSDSAMGIQWTELIEYGKSLKLGPVVVVDVLDPIDSAKIQGQLDEADFDLRPDLTGIGYLDFNRKTEAAFRGKSAIIQRIEEIKRQLGGRVSRE